MRNMGVFSADLPGRLSPEASPKLPRPWASKLAHVNSVRPEPKRLVGKICSVHVFENINKSHSYEIIVSQVAWMRKKKKKREGKLTVGNGPVQLISEEVVWDIWVCVGRGRYVSPPLMCSPVRCIT